MVLIVVFLVESQKCKHGLGNLDEHASEGAGGFGKSTAC